MSKELQTLDNRPNRLLVGLFLTLGVLGVIVMITSLVFAFFVPQAATGRTGLDSLLHPRPLVATPAPSTDASDDGGIPPLTMKDYHYTFTKKAELKDFKTKGNGTLSLSKGRLQLKASPGSAFTATRSFRMLAPGTISLDARTSSEPNYDTGTVIVDALVVDGVIVSGDYLVPAISGDSRGHYSIDLPGGEHTLTFTYAKDWDVAQGADAFYITNLRIPKVGTGGWA